MAADSHNLYYVMSNSRFQTAFFMDIRNKCLRPVRFGVSNQVGSYVPEFRCGKCPDCLRNLRNQLMVRAYREALSSPMVYMTFTYDDAHMPVQYSEEYIDDVTGEVYSSNTSIIHDSDFFFEHAPYKWRINKDCKKTKRYSPLILESDAFYGLIPCKLHRTWYFTFDYDDIKKLLKRFRQRFPDFEGKYCIVPEYGSVGYRPHFHLLGFGFSKHHYNYLIQDWQFDRKFGYVDLDVPDQLDSSHRIASYVSKYCCKGVFDCPYIGQYCRKPRRCVSIDFGKGSDSDWEKLKSYVLAYDVFGKYNPLTINPEKFTDNDIRLLISRRCIIINGKYKYGVPKYLLKKLFYCYEIVFDSDIGAFVPLLRSCELSKKIAKVIQDDLRFDFDFEHGISKFKGFDSSYFENPTITDNYSFHDDSSEVFASAVRAFQRDLERNSIY